MSTVTTNANAQSNDVANIPTSMASKELVFLTSAEVLDSGQRIVRAVINTDDVDRFGTVIKPKGVRFENFFKSGGAVLYNHDQSMVIGKCLEIIPTEHSLTAKWQFVDASKAPERGPLLSKIEDLWFLYSNGYLRGHSIHVIPEQNAVEYNHSGVLIYNRTELVEFSLTPVPVNPNAIVRSVDAAQRYANILPPQALDETIKTWPKEDREKFLSILGKQNEPHKDAPASSPSLNTPTKENVPPPETPPTAQPRKRSFLGKTLPNIATRIFNQPLMIQPQKMETILSVLDNRIIALPDNERPEEPKEKPALERPGIAVIPVWGTLVHRTMGLNALSGLTSYDSIRQRFRKALADPQVKAIAFDIDSSGGEVSGCFDLVDEIYQSRGKKPIWAFVNESAYSAAYAIASAADIIIAPRTAMVGSIGVYAMHVDMSRFDAMHGVEYEYIYAGEHKLDGNPHQPLSNEARQVMQTIIDQVYDLFVSTVARNRGLPEETVRNIGAKVIMSHEAAKLGLVDVVGNCDELMDLVAPGIQSDGAVTGSSGEDDSARVRLEQELEQERNNAKQLESALQKERANVEALLRRLERLSNLVLAKNELTEVHNGRE